MRVLTVIGAYLLAIISGVLLYGIAGVIFEGSEPSVFWKFLTVYLPGFSALLAFNFWLTPFAVAGLAAFEFFQVDRWWPYPIGGAALGLIICAQGLPYSYDASFESMLPYYSCVMAGSTFAGLVYWFIAWRKWPPTRLDPQARELAQ